jgi:hypothetical protein
MMDFIRQYLRSRKRRELLRHVRKTKQAIALGNRGLLMQCMRDLPGYRGFELTQRAGGGWCELRLSDGYEARGFGGYKKSIPEAIAEAIWWMRPK